MNVVPLERHHSVLSHIGLFFALSRTPHGLLDMATPALAALLWYGAFPPLRTVLLGFITAFAGYTAVYALNDLMDYRVDKLKRDQGGFQDTEDYLDAVLVRHPMAYNLLSFKEALAWALAWTFVALIGAYLLNPVCVVIFVVACLLEGAYCLMWRTSCLRTLVSGAVKTSGGVAAVFAVDHHPSITFLVMLFLWLFFWEIGGQNIPADWTDIEEDRSMRAKTIPVCFRPSHAASMVFACLLMTVVLSGVLAGFSRDEGGRVFYTGASLATGIYLLIVPAYRLLKEGARCRALYLFNRASYYPAVLLAAAVIRVMV